MSNGAIAGAAIAQAIKALSAIVRVEPRDFMAILSKMEKPLSITSQGGFLKKNFQYLTGYKGLVFFTKSPAPLELTSDIELIAANEIWIPC